MQIWTKAEFKDESHKYWSKRNGTIAEIDDRLEKYHDPSIDSAEKGKRLTALWGKVVDFEKEKKTKHAANPEKQSKNRKNAVHTLRTQVEWNMWQLDYDKKKKERDDLNDFFAKRRSRDAHDFVIRDWLSKLKVTVRQGDPATSKLKVKLHEDIVKEFAKPYAGKRWFDEALKTKKYPWVGPGHKYVTGYYEDTHGPDTTLMLQDSLRVATVDMESVLGDGDITYMGADIAKWTDLDKKAIFHKFQQNDPIVGHLQSVNQVAEYLSIPLRKTLEDYLRSLLKVDLELQSKLVERILACQPGFKALVHIDYYATRSVDKVGLHKDTNGNNLFAVLDYINEDPMLGPEYIDDPAPMRTENPGYYLADEIYANLEGITRSGAPWASLDKDPKTGEDRYVWPNDLIWALQNVRMSPPNQDSNGKLHGCVLPKDALVSFVDELIFHATPVVGHRTEAKLDDLPRYLHAGVTFPTVMKDHAPYDKSLNIFEAYVKQDRVERRMSAHYTNEVHDETGLAIPGAKSGGVRRFFRLWICIVPEHWYKPNAKYT